MVIGPPCENERRTSRAVVRPATIPAVGGNATRGGRGQGSELVASRVARCRRGTNQGDELFCRKALPALMMGKFVSVTLSHTPPQPSPHNANCPARRSRALTEAGAAPIMMQS